MKIETARLNNVVTKFDISRNKTLAEKTDQTTVMDNTAFNVHLSGVTPKEISELEREDEIRQAKVAAIRDQLASGSYTISGKDVAEKILNAIIN